ncbi:MAG TPA: MFS transporter [Opitutaceae bacterium]|nr:MFS transporter [Opitutaceae bacterium]
MSATPQRLLRREKIGYSLGDIATNFFFQSMILYQTRFYTDTAGLSAAAVGTMLLVLRLADAVVDPAVGALSDRTKTRWGKFRPWILWTAVPFGVVFWAAYVSPHGSQTVKLLYAYGTYVLLMMLYSANNTPYSALMGVITPDDSERSSVASYRFAGALIGQFIFQGLALPFVDKFGHGDSARGWAITMGIFGALMIVFYFITFATTRERVQPDPRQKSDFKQDLRDVFTCRPWLMIFILTFLIFTTLVVRGTCLNYYFAYYLDAERVRAFLGEVGLASAGAGTSAGWKAPLDALGLLAKPDGSNAASVFLSFFFDAGSIVQIVGIIFSKPLANRFGKKTVFFTGMLISTLGTAAIFFVPRDSVNLLFYVGLIWAAGWGPTVPLLWLMIADSADYSEWKGGRRATGFMFAGILFALKAGLGLGGALSAWLLGAYDYVANAVQTPHALLGIRLSATIYSALPFALGLVFLAFYPITKELGARIQAELTERRKAYAAA